MPRPLLKTTCGVRGILNDSSQITLIFIVYYSRPLQFSSTFHYYLLSCSSADFLSIGVCMCECVCVSVCVSPSSSLCFCLCCRLWISLSSCKASWDRGRNSGEEEVGSEGWLLRVTIDGKRERQQQQQYVLVRWSRQAPPLPLRHWGDETTLLLNDGNYWIECLFFDNVEEQLIVSEVETGLLVDALQQTTQIRSATSVLKFTDQRKRSAVNRDGGQRLFVYAVHATPCVSSFWTSIKLAFFFIRIKALRVEAAVCCSDCKALRQN